MTNHSMTYNSFPRYLAAKKSVDDRALNQHVWHTLQTLLQERSIDLPSPLQVTEIGGGIGTMIERMVDRGLLISADYTLVDALSENLATAQERLPRWAREAGYTVEERQKASSWRIRHPSTNHAVTVKLEPADCFDFAAQPAQAGRYDLLIAHAFLDLVDIPRALPRLRALLCPRALCYLTINFDGGTILQPEIDPVFDQLIESVYHETMDKRMTNGQPSGDSHSGRHLFGHLRAAGIEIIDAGSSDWVVFAGRAGYPADEAYFLHFIIQTMQGALKDHPALDQPRFHTWIEKRHAQIERGELVYIAHQLDFLGRLR